MISIVIPTFNEEKLIRNTLTRLTSKITLPHEIIVSDGKSTDKTAEIAREYADKVLVYDGKGRQKISEGRNAGAKASSGKFLVFLDADCRIDEPDLLFKNALSEFERNPKLLAQAAWIKVFPENETVADKWVWFFMNTGNQLLNFFGVGAAPGEFQMIRKDAFKKIDGFNEKLVATEDYDMFSRLAKDGLVRLNPKLVVYHSGRHAHTLGWPKMLWIWFSNTFSYAVRGKSYSKEWTVIR